MPKISQLPAAVTPLAGNELVPIVQAGVTDSVAASAIANTLNALTGTIAGTYTLAGSPVIASPSISNPTLTGTAALGGVALSGTATGTYTLAGTPTITSAVLTGPSISNPVLSGTATGTYTLAGTPVISSPSISNPVLSGTATGTYTLAGTPTITSATLTGPSISNPVLSGTATGTYTLAGTPTITSAVLTGPSINGTITGTYTLGGTPTFPNSGVVAGTYTNATFSVAADGFITAAVSGPVGALAFLSVQTASNSTAVAFTSVISSTYNKYLLEFDDVIVATNTSVLQVQVSTDNGSTWKATNYIWSTIGGIDGSAVSGGSGSDTAATIAGIVATSANSLSNTLPASGEIYFANVNSTANPVMFGGATRWPRQSDGLMVAAVHGGYWNGTGAAITAIRILSSSGNITSGNFRLYGLQKS